LQNLVLVCARNDAVRSKVASGLILAQSINSVEVAKLTFCNWLRNFDIWQFHVEITIAFFERLLIFRSRREKAGTKVKLSELSGHTAYDTGHVKNRNSENLQLQHNHFDTIDFFRNFDKTS
jgi:hypothetical protein